MAPKEAFDVIGDEETEYQTSFETADGIRPTRVAIIGAGPAGLLAAIFLLRRNNAATRNKKYQVILIDPGTDYGKLDAQELKRFRSWMIGLSAHGLSAVKEVPGLYEKYLADLGVHIRGATFGVGSMSFSQRRKEGDKEIRGFTVDRNYICAGLARYIYDHFESKKSSSTELQGGEELLFQEYISHYHTKVMFVDGEEKKLIVKKNITSEENNSSTYMEPIPYDIVLGCDGVRSVVRNSFIMNHRDFEFTLKDNFGLFKSVHIDQPKGVPDGQFMMLTGCMPNGAIAVVLPEQNNVLNLAVGGNKNKPLDPELSSKDPKVITNYFKTHFKVLGDDLNYEQLGQEWVKQEFSTTSMAYCNFYHSHKLNALLMGDAAHATVPNIGQGMNTALADASVLNRLLDTHQDNWDELLPAFSKERVKEGNALTTLSFHTYSLSPTMQMEIFLRQTVRKMLNTIFPSWLIAPEPMVEISKGMKLSEAYDRMIQLGWLQKSRRINEETMRSHFEKECGMVTTAPKKKSNWLYGTLLGMVACSGLYFALANQQQDFMKHTVHDLVGSALTAVTGRM